EGRISRFKLLLFILIVGIVSNTAQYLASGPYFLGYSGIVVGMAGFIWMRQRQAPWEGYPLPKATSLFFFFFVLAMVALDLIALGLRSFFSFELTANIANTAHIVGGLCGIFLGKLSFFARAKP
ncbi:MAG: rhomboid family intramembrane serine protease, partial [Chlamydiales bacterium]|nr:rhomboid family intramembrane serine protease [Chlamydiales bacterium]